jgi:para-aminobenzoate synthetase component 1
MKHANVGFREPLWQEIPFEEPVHLARRLRNRGRLIFLDSAMPHESLGRYAYLATDPVAIIGVDDASPLDSVRHALGRGRLDHVDGLPPFQGGLAGYIAYEFGCSLEPQLASRIPRGTIAPLQLHAYDVVLAFDLVQRRAFVVSTGFPETDDAHRLITATERLQDMLNIISRPAERYPPRPPGIAHFQSNFTRTAYEQAIRRTIEYVLAGDIFQANIAQRFTATLPDDFDAFGFYEALRQKNPATFAAYLDCGDLKICSSSPERLMSFDGKRAEARPIKGTRRRVSDSGVDAILKADLLASRKDRAENVMIVDLLRNDLSRVCRPGTVEVPVLCGLESYASVHHLVSVVTGELDAGYEAVDLIAACFPGGSITGAPKIRAMEIIGELERLPRDIYCGAIGFLGFSGRMDFNIAIRTVTCHRGIASFHGGGGITARSDPSAEYDETLAKVQRIMEAFRAS